MFYTYIVECSDKSYYCGYTNALDSRVNEHNNDRKGARYTKARRPVRLVYSESYDSKEEAIRREVAIKKLSRKQKEILVLSKN